MLFIIINKYVYACDISYYTIILFILQPLFLRKILFFTSQWHLF